ncbi:MAG: hypothetical protein WD037_09255 [Balneolales bacterium]
MENVKKTSFNILWFSLLLIIGAIFVGPGLAQAQVTGDELWLRYEQRQAEHYEAGRVLLTWGAASLAGGSLFLFTDIKDFGLMTAGWGAVNTAIAATTLLNPSVSTREENNISDLLRKEQRYNRIVAVNTGLNVSYIAAGLGMVKYGAARSTREYGAAILAQGAFLLVYDSVLLYLSSRYLNQISLYPAYINSVLPYQDSSGSGGFTLNVKF